MKLSNLMRLTCKLPITPDFKIQLYLKLFVPENSGLLHIAFVENRRSSTSNILSNVKVINENGDELLKVPDGSQIVVSELEGLPTKLLVSSNNQGLTKVYSISYPNATKNFLEQLSAQVYPNPFDNTLTIKLDAPQMSPTDMLEIRLFDLAGKQVLTKTTAASAEIPLPEAANLANGFYFLRIMDGARRQVVLKIVKE